MRAPATTSTRTVHVVDAHLTYPGWSEGSLNDAMVEKVRTHLHRLGHHMTRTVVEEGYDVQDEVQRHVEADLVILQTPINWFGAPWIYKRYVDEVFNAGLHSKRFMENDGRSRSDSTRQYGTGGLMQGRGFFVSATWNAPLDIFDDDEGVLLRGKGLDDLLLHMSASYRFVGFDILEHYGLYDVFRSHDLAAQIDLYPRHLDRQLATIGVHGAREPSVRGRSTDTG